MMNFDMQSNVQNLENITYQLTLAQKASCHVDMQSDDEFWFQKHGLHIGSIHHSDIRKVLHKV